MYKGIASLSWRVRVVQLPLAFCGRGTQRAPIAKLTRRAYKLQFSVGTTETCLKHPLRRVVVEADDTVELLQKVGRVRRKLQASTVHGLHTWTAKPSYNCHVDIT